MKSIIPRKESIIITAVEIIDELGINELALRELASRQGISEMALYRHFKNKEEIVMAVIDYYCRYDLNIKNTIDNNNMNPKEGIIFFVKSLLQTYENQPAMASIVNAFETLQQNNNVVNKVKEIYTSRFEYIKSLVEKGQKAQAINTYFTAESMADMIIGLKRASIIRWRISNCSFSLTSHVVTSLESLLRLV